MTGLHKTTTALRSASTVGGCERVASPAPGEAEGGGNNPRTPVRRTSLSPLPEQVASGSNSPPSRATPVESPAWPAASTPLRRASTSPASVPGGGGLAVAAAAGGGCRWQVYLAVRFDRNHIMRGRIETNTYTLTGQAFKEEAARGVSGEMVAAGPPGIWVAGVE